VGCRHFSGKLYCLSERFVESEMMDLNNQKRLTASQIIVDLYEAKKVEQLKILQAQIASALKGLGARDDN
jgi:hypothetical protein